MHLSLNRKIIYLILSLTLILSSVFISSFYIVYSSKIEKDQQSSIFRNQQYNDLLYRHINLNKELKQVLSSHKEFNLTEKNYPYIYALTQESQQTDSLETERRSIVERSQKFDEQYRTISNGIIVIAISSLSIMLLIALMGFLINKWILIPINKISNISEEIGRGNLNLRIPMPEKINYPDELDNLSKTLNMMLDNLQSMMNEIQDKEKFLQALIDSIPDGIRVIDENYHIIAANKAYYKQSGDTKKENKFCYASSFKTTYPCNPEHVQCPLHEILKNNKKSITIIQQFSDRPQTQLSVNAAPLIYDDTHKYIVESIRDLSEEIDFSHQQKISSLGFLSSSIAHEIKNQLGALRLIMEHMIDKYYSTMPDDCEQKKMIDLLHNELVNAVNVPEHLLKLTRNYGTSETEIDCAESIKEILSLLDFEAKSKGVDIIYDKPQIPIIIRGNETDFKIAVINIILNAIKAMTSKGKLTIKIKQNSHKDISISFSDTGVGIPKENLEHIFNPFFSEGRQGSNTRGSGLGLAITKSIIEKTGGTIGVTSKVGKGSCFTISFKHHKKT